MLKCRRSKSCYHRCRLLPNRGRGVAGVHDVSDNGNIDRCGLANAQYCSTCARSTGTGPNSVTVSPSISRLCSTSSAKATNVVLVGGGGSTLVQKISTLSPSRFPGRSKLINSAGQFSEISARSTAIPHLTPPPAPFIDEVGHLSPIA